MNRMSKMHIVKSSSRFFKAILSGAKTWDVRVNDRDYHYGDSVMFCEWLSETQEFTGRTISCHILDVWIGVPNVRYEAVVLQLSLPYRIYFYEDDTAVKRMHDLNAAGYKEENDG